MASPPVSTTTAFTVVEPTSRPTMYFRSLGPPQSQASCLTASKTLALEGLSPLSRSRSLTVTSIFTLPLDQPALTSPPDHGWSQTSIVPVGNALEAADRLLQQPLDHAGVVVTE